MARHTGYWYRKGRGWYITEGRSQVPLLDEQGERLKDRKDRAGAKAAYARYLAGVQERRQFGPTVQEIADFYLPWCQSYQRPKTYLIRSFFVHDFATYYGERRTATLSHLDIDRWWDRHDWNSTTRNIAITSVKRAVNFAISRGKLPSSPLRGYKAARLGKRVTYFTPEQEAAMYRHANPAFALALRVLIRTGARPGCEFAALTAPALLAGCLT